ncbi:MAG: hypothetical protein ACI957_003512 [Verrucomicrobiales bacterium]|jgi:hypothetical protein
MGIRQGQYLCYGFVDLQAISEFASYSVWMEMIRQSRVGTGQPSKIAVTQRQSRECSLPERRGFPE